MSIEINLQITMIKNKFFNNIYSTQFYLEILFYNNELMCLIKTKESISLWEQFKKEELMKRFTLMLIILQGRNLKQKLLSFPKIKIL